MPFGAVRDICLDFISVMSLCSSILIQHLVLPAYDYWFQRANFLVIHKGVIHGHLMTHLAFPSIIQSPPSKITQREEFNNLCWPWVIEPWPIDQVLSPRNHDTFLSIYSHFQAGMVCS